MSFYFIGDEIIEYTEGLDSSLYNYQALDEEQEAFYLDHPNASIQEIKDCELNTVPVLTLDQLKIFKIQFFSDLAFQEREKLFPEYKIMNAGLPSVYSSEEVLNIARIVTEFRTEFYRLKGLVESATTIEELDSIQDNYHLIEA